MARLMSKLPQVGTTVFTVMTQRAQELGAINLAQGFPDYEPPARLRELLAEHAARGQHQYAPMPGLPALREAIVRRLERNYGVPFDPVDEVTITLGATEGLFSALLALVHRDDEVILFDPSYDSYAPAVVLAGGKPVRIPLRITASPAARVPQFYVDWDEVEARVTQRTRLIVINTPHNPTGAVFSASDVAALERLVERADLLVLADEVYESMVFDGQRHISLCARAALRERALSVFSFGKPLHATGWRVGYVLASSELTRELRRVHQFNTFTIATPLQGAIADFMTELPDYTNQLATWFQNKRDRFVGALAGTSLRVVPSQGTYFQLVDFGAISSQSDLELAERLLVEAGVASIPISPFYAEPPHVGLLRFCFAKQDATLDEAAARLRAFASR